jgi:hypothetical protein
MGNALQVMSGSRPTAKDLREEREALRIYRSKEIQNLRDLKANMTVDAKAKTEYALDIATASILIDNLITYIQSHNEDEIALQLDTEKPRILAFIASFPERARIKGIIAGIAATTKDDTITSPDKKSLIRLSERLQEYLKDETKFGASSEEIRQFVATECETTLADIIKTDTGADYRKKIQDAMKLSDEDIARLKASPTILKKTTYIAPNYMSIATKTIIVCVIVGIAITAGMLAANDAIYRPLGFRLLNFVYGGAFCFVTLPYYLIRWFRDKAPKYYSLLPLYERREGEEATNIVGEFVQSMFSYVKDDYYKKAVAAFKEGQDAMTSQ